MLILNIKIFLLSDDLKIYRDIKSAGDCKSPQAVISSVKQWGSENYMEFNFQKIKIIYFIHKTNSITLNYYVSDILILRSECRQ